MNLQAGRIVVLLVATLYACGESSPLNGVRGSARGVPIGTAREAIIGGALDTTHSAVIAVLGSVPGGPSNAYEACTGSIVQVKNGVGYVLTAAHCCGADPRVSTSVPQLVVDADDYVSYEGEIGNPHPAAPSYAVIDGSVKWDPAYDGLEHDFCMLQFSNALPSQPTLALPATATDGLSLQTSIELVGFGVTSLGVKNTTRYHSTSSVDQELSSAILKYTVNASIPGPCRGDSGGPALVPANAPQSSQTVVAVTSYGDPTCTEYGVSSRVRSAMGPNGFITNYLAGGSVTDAGLDGCSDCDAATRPKQTDGGEHRSSSDADATAQENPRAELPGPQRVSPRLESDSGASEGCSVGAAGRPRLWSIVIVSLPAWLALALRRRRRSIRTRCS